MTTTTAEVPDPDQAWFWTEAWQAGERQASAEIAAGDLAVYDDMEALFADVDAPTTPTPAP